MDAVWYRDVKESDGVIFQFDDIPIFDEDATLVEVTFDGLYNNLINFTLKEVEGKNVEKKEFHFNPNPDGGTTMVNFKGIVLEVVKADNLGLYYKWVQING